MITEENFIDFTCPYCREPASFPQANAGFLQACPNCGQSLIVPSESGGVGGQPPLPITTARLALRRFNPGDWKGLLELVSDEELFPYLEGWPLEEEGMITWLERDGHVKLTTPDQPFFLGIELIEGAKLIGYTSLHFAEPQRLQAQLNVVLSRGFQRQGLACEAVGGLLSFCFNDIKLHRIWAQCDATNAAGCHLFEKVRMRREGLFIKNKFITPDWVDTVCYAVLAEETGRG